MQEEEFIISTFVIILSLLILVFLLISIPLLIYSKKRSDDRNRMLALENHFQNELLKSRLEVQEQTLQDLARELHDNIGSLISIAIAYHVADMDDQERKTQVYQLLKKAMGEIRGLSRTLSIDVIKADGLAKAIEGVVNQLRKIDRFNVEYQVIGHYNLYDVQVEIVAFRILQEAINNIIRHSDATEISITFHCEPDTMILTISDNGKGFSTGGPPKAGGLNNMRTRAALIKANLEIASAPHSGSVITLSIPLISNANATT